MSGQVDDEDIAAFLLAQARRGPALSEIVGAVRAMRGNMLTIRAPADAIDLCGTGGDGQSTLNISTAVAFVVAACGVPVAKHGNRSISSRSGAADVLEALGAAVSLAPEAATECLGETGLCFLFAPTYHPAMKHVAAVRKRLGVRTIFNLLGPLCNPACVRRQLVGVYAKDLVELFAQALRELKAERAWIVHGSDGLDEITATGETHVAMLENSLIAIREVTPQEIGLRQASTIELKGDDAAHNAKRLIELFEGGRGAYRDIVVLNAAAALTVAGKATNLSTGASLADAAIASGKALGVLHTFVKVSAKLAS